MASTDPSPLSLKELGNAAFKAREHSQAAKHYQDALELIRSDAKAADADLCLLYTSPSPRDRG